MYTLGMLHEHADCSKRQCNASFQLEHSIQNKMATNGDNSIIFLLIIITLFTENQRNLEEIELPSSVWIEVQSLPVTETHLKQRFFPTSIWKNENKRHRDVTASCGSTFQTDQKTWSSPAGRKS